MYTGSDIIIYCLKFLLWRKSWNMKDKYKECEVNIKEQVSEV